MNQEIEHADILRYIVKHHRDITAKQWAYIRAVLDPKEEIFPDEAYRDCAQFDEDVTKSLPLKLQASVAHEHLDSLLGVIERQMFLERPNWVRWIIDWLDMLKSTKARE